MINLLAKCIRFHEFGNPEEVLKAEYKRIQPLQKNEILVRMLARPINPSDIIPIRGNYSHRISLPGIPGYEGIGIVEDVGAEGDRSLIGKRVLPLRGEGTWQEFVKTSAQFAVAVPDSIDDYAASQLYINPVTAWVICTEELGLRPSDTLLVNACNSAIGRIFAQLSRVIGFRLIAVTRNQEPTNELLRLGASNIINTSENLLYETVMDLTQGFGAVAAVDSVGGPAGHELALCVRPNGSFVSLGLLSGIQLNWTKIHQAKVNAKIFHLRHWNRRVSTGTWQETFNRLMALITAGQLKLKEPAYCYDLSEVKEAVIVAESSGSGRGKVILTSDY
ncbi:zinc-dependent alcohol dehydrogenase family protein [Paenibacillaceae bacterium WGS1546]|uniref:zinc-dependent alcohol dehydrogenase family protein n=1 Tax=Cohnella sp. WGS1546 TaxID=3366810 RepID=UPI00372D7BA9